MTSQEKNYYKSISEGAGGTTGNSSTTTTSHTEPGVQLLREPEEIELKHLQTLRMEYNNVIGPLNCIIAGEIEKYLGIGIQAAVILDALRLTACAPRPTWYYMRAILERYTLHGVRTMEDVRKDQAERSYERYRGNQKKWAAWYEVPEDNLDF